MWCTSIRSVCRNRGNWYWSAQSRSSACRFHWKTHSDCCEPQENTGFVKSETAINRIIRGCFYLGTESFYLAWPTCTDVSGSTLRPLRQTCASHGTTTNHTAGIPSKTILRHYGTRSTLSDFHPAITGKYRFTLLWKHRSNHFDHIDLYSFFSSII